MIRILKSPATLLLIILCTLLTGCNKDDVILDDTEESQGGPRPITDSSRASFDMVYEWMPAPGQFINMSADGGGNLTTPEDAVAWAQKRLDKGSFVTLGGFGGYIVVGFDHSIISSNGDYDFAIAGNSFLNTSAGSNGSNEPGIVYVMQDTNGNGLPDDTWYELKGSEYGRPETMTNYEVTYFRPASAGIDVEWVDNRGNSGTIDYQASFHSQSYYYPLWIAEESYTLKGVCLPSRTYQDPSSGFWILDPYGWGYADNVGDDTFALEGFPQCNRFRISDAIGTDGRPVRLEYIDFVKVQSAVNAKSGWIGEVSTEVLGFFDLHI